MDKRQIEKMIQYFIEQKNNGVSHWCINDLIGQLYQAKEMEKEQIRDAYVDGADKGEMFNNENRAFTTDSEQYYNKTFKSE